MFDKLALKIVKPFVDNIARKIYASGITANAISFLGFGFGIAAALLIVFGYSGFAIAPLLINRAADGIDGAVARLGTTSDRGAFLDITLDFLFYASIPLAFAFCDPARNAMAASVLLASFIGTGVSFLAYAIMAAKRGDSSADYPSKGFYYLGGLTEGTETIACFLLMCAMPNWFVPLAYVYGALCCITTVTRMIAGWQRFGA